MKYTNIPSKKILLLFAGLLFIKILSADNIDFHKGGWSEAVKEAKRSGKLIFVDFYTDWCGPCLNMADEVFTHPKVYYYFNNTFVNLKIDAEKGEGVLLAKRYGVNLFPTFLFIDPETEKVLHKSSSRQSVDQFLYTARSASIPERRSFFLEENYESRLTDIHFLQNYIEYQASVYKNDKVADAFDRVIELKGSLTDKLSWELFERFITGPRNRYIKEVSENYGEFVSIFGKQRVDEKLAKETLYANTQEISQFCDFDGKHTNETIIGMNAVSAEGNFDKLISIIDKALIDNEIDKNKFLNSLRFTIRSKNRNLLSLPPVWIKKCGGYYQYIAYNYKDRDDASIHYEYAQYLESVIKMIPEASAYLPESIINKPIIGKSDYSLRSDVLKQKPKR